MTATTERPVSADDPADDPAAELLQTPGWRSWVLAAGVPTAVTGLHWTFYGKWIIDDAGLTFAYARSLATGAGPVLQPGAEPVEGFSNPAWLAILTAGRGLGLFDHGAWFGVSDIVVFPKLVAIVCCFGVFAAMFAVAQLVTTRPVAVTLVAGIATALVPSWAIWTASGLENALFALVVTTLAAVLVRGAARATLLDPKVAVAAGLLAALAALTRPDGLVYAAAFPVVAVLCGSSRGRGWAGRCSCRSSRSRCRRARTFSGAS